MSIPIRNSEPPNKIWWHGAAGFARHQRIRSKNPDMSPAAAATKAASVEHILLVYYIITRVKGQVQQFEPARRLPATKTASVGQTRRIMAPSSRRFGGPPALTIICLYRIWRNQICPPKTAATKSAFPFGNAFISIAVFTGLLKRQQPRRRDAARHGGFSSGNTMLTFSSGYSSAITCLAVYHYLHLCLRLLLAAGAYSYKALHNKAGCAEVTTEESLCR